MKNRTLPLIATLFIFLLSACGDNKKSKSGVTPEARQCIQKEDGKTYDQHGVEHPGCTTTTTDPGLAPVKTITVNGQQVALYTYRHETRCSEYHKQSQGQTEWFVPTFSENQHYCVSYNFYQQYYYQTGVSASYYYYGNTYYYQDPATLAPSQQYYPPQYQQPTYVYQKCKTKVLFGIIPAYYCYPSTRSY